MGYAIGQVATSATTETPVEATAYAEQASGANRALKSSSAADTALGTGARTVRVTYFTLAADGTISGPFVETVTLNGVTAVPMVATNLALVEKMEILTAGSGGVAAGTISLTVNNDGTGGTIASIALGAVQTLLAHHYVAGGPSAGAQGRRSHVVGINGMGGDPALATLALKVKKYGTPDNIERPLIIGVGCSNAQPAAVEPSSPMQTVITGPARLRLYVTPANVNAQTTTAAVGFFDE